MGVEERRRGPLIGWRQARILAVMARYFPSGVPYWTLVREICGEDYTEQCRVDVSKSLHGLVRRDYLYRKRYMGQKMYYLTRKGRELLHSLSLGP